MNISIPKLKAMILYFAKFTDARFLGKTKLMKLFYFTDFGHVKKYASPITHDNYVHLEHGPIPSTIMNFIGAVENEAEEAILSDIISIEQKEGSNMKKVVPLREFVDKDKEYLSSSELKVMEDICSRFKDSTGKEIEEASHKESAFTDTREGESISYLSAADDPDCLISKQDIENILYVLN